VPGSTTQRALRAVRGFALNFLPTAPTAMEAKEIPLPKFVRFVDLKAARIVDNWTQLKRIVETEGFPPGIMLAPIQGRG